MCFAHTFLFSGAEAQLTCECQHHVVPSTVVLYGTPHVVHPVNHPELPVKGALTCLPTGSLPKAASGQSMNESIIDCVLLLQPAACLPPGCWMVM